VELLTSTSIPALFMLIFFIGIIVSAWIAQDPIRQKNRKSKYFLITLICFVGFLLAAYWDMK